MDEALWEALLDNIFRIFPYRCVPQRNHEYLRLVPREGGFQKACPSPLFVASTRHHPLDQRKQCRVWLVIHPGLDSATRQPQATAHGIDEVESLAVTQHAIPRIPLA
jgi:hypothetical protein